MYVTYNVHVSYNFPLIGQLYVAIILHKYTM